MSAVPPAAPRESESGWRYAKASYPVRRVAVLGAGTMGARIAAHIANAGFPVLLLDLAQPGNPNLLAMRAIEALKKAKPPALTSLTNSAAITPGNFDSDLPRLGECDWVIEAVSEQMEIKRKLLANAAPHLGHATIFTTNTSGLPISALGEALPEELRKRWFGTHFFNPPRYMRLLEVIPTAATDPEAIASVTRFADLHLGKEVVEAKDSPSFIANRVGLFTMLNSLRAMRELNLTIEEVDALTGTPLGWPKTGTFRLADMIGIDVLVNVARNFLQQADRQSVEAVEAELPAIFDEMLRRNWLGDKTGQGFYRKERQPDGSDRRLVLDFNTMEYREWKKPVMPELDAAKKVEPLSMRLRALVTENPQGSRAAAFYRAILPDLWNYSANRLGEISDSIADIDRAMQAGFHWELGPFAMWDAAGFPETVERMQAEGKAAPPVVRSVLDAGFRSWYRGEGSEQIAISPPRYLPVESTPGTGLLHHAKRSGGVVTSTPVASLIDIGDGAAAIEFHSKMNTLGQETVGFVGSILASGSEYVQNFQCFIIANDGDNFSAGANLMQVLVAAQGAEWEEIDRYIRKFQEMTQAVKFCPRPVVAAPFALTLGGGAEICLHAAVCQAHLELYTGLVEAGVGLVPAGGGLKEMMLRTLEAAGEVQPQDRADSIEVFDAFHHTFRLIATAKVSSSAVEARTMRLLRQRDGITNNRERLARDAKSLALHLSSAGYVPPLPRRAIPSPGESLLATLRIEIHMMKEAGRASDYDALIAEKIAHVLSGGGATTGVLLEEQNLLDLEREAFLSLCGEPRTQARIAHTLKTGKPLRN